MQPILDFYKMANLQKHTWNMLCTPLLIEKNRCINIVCEIEKDIWSFPPIVTKSDIFFYPQ